MRPESRTPPGLAEALPELLRSLDDDASPRNVIRVAEGLRLVGRPEEAVELLESHLPTVGAGVAGRILLAWCFEDADRPEEAARARAAARELDPANPYAAETGERAERQAEPERALTVEELAHVPPSPLYSATLAEIFERQGFEEKALEIYREIVRLHPERRDLHRRIDTLTEREDEGEGPS